MAAGMSAVLGEALVPIRVQFDQLQRDLARAQAVTREQLSKAMGQVGRVTEQQLARSAAAAGQAVQQSMTASMAGVQQTAEQAAQATEAAIQRASTAAQQAVQRTGRAAGEAVGKALQKAGSKVRDFGESWTKYATLPITGAGAAAIKLAGDFEYALNIFRSVSNATADQMERVRQLAIQLGNDTKLPGTSAVDAAAAMTELVKAGLNVEQAMKAARGTLILAAAAEVDNAEAATIAANALNAFRLGGDQATRVADILANTANAASGEIIDIAYALRQSAAVAAMAGQTIEDTATAIGLMANAGIQGADAGTSLKQMFLSLINPSSKAAKLMKKYGISVVDARGQLKPLPQLIEEFRTKLGKLPPAQRNAALATIFGSDAIRAANIVLMASREEWDQMRAAVTRAGGAQEVAAAKMQGFRGSLEALKSSLETLGIQLGEKILPHVTRFIQGVTKLVDWFGELPGPVQTAIIAMAGIVAIIGPLLVGLGAVVNAIGTLVTWAPALSAGFGAVATAAGPVVLGAMAAATALFLLFRAGKAVWPKLAGGAKKAGPVIAGAMERANKALGRLGQGLRSALGRAADWVGETAGRIGSGIGRAGQAVGAALGRAGAALAAFVRNGVAQLQTFLGRVASWAAGVVRSATSAMTRFGAAISTGLSRALRSVVTFVTTAGARAQAFFRSLATWAGSAATQVAGAMARFGSAVGNAMSQAAARVASFTSAAAARLQSFVGSVASWGASIAARASAAMSSFASAVQSGINRAVSFFSSLGSRIVSAVKGAVGRVASIGRDIAEGLWRGISNMTSTLRSKILAWAKKIIPDPLERFFGIRSPSRLMARYGKFIAEGLVKGLTGSASDIKKAAEQAAKLIREAFGGARERRLLRMLDSNTARLKKLAAQRDAIAQQIAEANKMATDVASKAREYAALSSLNLGGEGPVTADRVIQALSDRLRQIKAFASNLRILERMGLSKDVMRQLIDMGAEQGGAYAAALVAGGAGAVAQINALQKQINTAAQGLGQTAADIMFDAGKQAAKGFLTGLTAQRKEIEALMLRIARSIQATLKRELRIRSPSRVMMDVGRNIVLGLAAGMERQASLVASAASYLAAQAAGVAAGGEAVALPVGAAGAAQVAGAAAGTPITIVVPVYLNGREIARVTAPYMDEAMAQLQRRVSRARGEVY